MKILITLLKEKDSEPIKPIEYQGGQETEEVLARVVSGAVKDWIGSGFREIKIEIDPEK